MDTLLRILNSRSASLEKFAYYVWEASLEDTSGLVNFVNKLTEDMDVWSSWRYGGMNGRLRDWAMEAIVSYADTGNAFGAFVKDHWSSEASTIAGKVYGTKGKAALLYGMLGSKFIKDYTVHAGDYASGWGSIIGSVHLPTFFDIPGMISIPVSPGGTLLPIDVPESITTSINGDFRMNLSEHHLYGSSRLGIKDYHSSQYQVVYSDTGSEIYSWQGLGGRKPWYSLVYAENISSLGTEPYGMAETNAYSVSHQIGRKQYELANHLGNVQATVSDHRYTLYREEGNAWVVDRYHPVLVSAYDYYPFGMLMPDRYVSDTTSYCQTISQTKWMKKLTEICWTVSAPSSWPTIVTEGSASTTVSVSSVEIDIPAPSSTAEFSVMVTPAEENELLLTSGMVIGVGIVEVYEVIGGNEYILASMPIVQSQLPSQTKITFSPTSSEVKVKFKYGTSGWTWHGHSICITKPMMVSETYYVDVCDETGDKYRFGFNGQEKVNEISGIGNHNTAEFWEYDTRLGRRWNLDPVDQISISNYATFANNPVFHTDVEGDCPTCVKYLVKAGGKVWKTVSRKTYLNSVKNGGWGKVVTKKTDVSRKIAKNDADRIFGNKSVEHTKHTRNVNSKKVTKPHFQPPGDNEGKIFYQATPLFILNEKGIDKSFLRSAGEFLGEMIIDIISMGGANTAHAPTTNFGGFPIAQSPESLKQIFSNTLSNIGQEDKNDIDADGILDDKDFVCNGCGPDKTNVIPIKNDEGELFWEQIDGAEAIKYQNDVNYRREKFSESSSELNSTN